MKYVVRHGFFETNSSSTHQMVLSIKGKDEQGNEVNKETFADDVWDDLNEVRTISSKKRKALLLYQFKYFDALEDYGSLKEYFEDVSENYEARVADFNFAVELKDLGEALFQLNCFKGKIKETLPEITEEDLVAIEKAAPRYNQACLECFYNDVLDTCTCGVDYDHICKRFNIEKGNLDEELKLVDLILEDDVKFMICETIMGGIQDEELPEEL